MRLGLLCFLTAMVMQAQPGDLRGVWKAQGKAYLNLETAGVIFDPPSGKIPYRSERKLRLLKTSQSARPLIPTPAASSRVCRAQPCSLIRFRFCKLTGRCTSFTNAWNR